MRTSLSHILPVSEACEILGRPVIQRIVSSLYQLRRTTQGNTNNNAALSSSSSASPDNSSLEEDIDTLIEALYFVPGQNDGDDIVNFTTNMNSSVPGPIAAAWKRWETDRLLALDKPSLIQFLVPANLQPHSGPAGHMGLFDCWIYTLQGHAPTSTAAYYGGATSHLVQLADVFIFLAICQQYYQFQEHHKRKRRQKTAEVASTLGKEPSEATPSTTVPHEGSREVATSTEEDRRQEEEERVVERTVSTMALLAYRMYDSYQKKGIVTRDTIHRFLTDVHGEDSYKEPKASALLDVVFDDTEHASGWLQAAVSEIHFVKRVRETITFGKAHYLLDWLSLFGRAMIPPEEVPHSVAAYLDTMEHQPTSLCDVYALADHRLFEIKRRFHSLVQSCSPVIQGDPMGSSSSVSSSSPATEDDQSHPRHAIRLTSFCRAVSQGSEELGHGGYLPDKLARLVFATACHNNYSAAWDKTSNSRGGSKLYWTLTNVLQFGCVAVRRHGSQNSDPNTPLLRFLFHLFRHPEVLDDISSDGPLERSKHGGEEHVVAEEEEEGEQVLTRMQVARMFLLLVEYATFRLTMDAPKHIDSKEMTPRIVRKGHESALDTIILDANACSLLGLMPTSLSVDEKGSIELLRLVDQTLEDLETLVKDQMTFEEFCRWSDSADFETTGSISRLLPLMMEIRLVAAVVFGIPPTSASLELAIIAEIERRHKSRYPQKDLSRRGPRGTVWYLIESDWYKNWTTLLRQASGTTEDTRDGRGDKRIDKARGLRRISNTCLLVENGSLALRQDVKWKQDYDIVPPLAWSALQAWYDGGPPIYRTVVKYISSTGPSSPHSTKPRIPTENEIELYPFFVTIFMCDAASRGEARPFQQNHQLSRVNPVGILLVQLCRELDMDPSNARLWVMGSESSASMEVISNDWILALEESITEQRRKRGAKDNLGRFSLLLEIKDAETGLWPRGIDGKEWSFARKIQNEQSLSELGDGIVGLYNMGNTCYLNASVQCLSHTPVFREYFTSRSYLKDINTTNPLGHQGQLAQVCAVLINSLWKRFHNSTTSQPSGKRIMMPGSYALVNAPALTPKTFKDSLGKFNDHFSGNEQHDAQELLAFLLGGLSEDLNRIVDKPYIEAPDSDGRPDSELADIWWTNHLKREMSIIVALFTGQYKSLLTCRTCKYESARFEPFSFLQVPLPEDDHHSVTLILYPLKDGLDATKYCVRVHINGKLSDVLLALAKTLLLDENCQNRTPSYSAGDCDDNSSVDNQDAPQIPEEQIQAKARDLTIVDVRDGHITKIAPKTWSLHDLQNKETGELPLLHVFELDPVLDRPINSSLLPDNQPKVSRKDSGGYTSDDSTAFDMPPKPKIAFLAVCQRRTEVTCRDFLHPLAHRVFGTPLLIRINNFDTCTGSALYDIIAKRLRNFVPKSALRFLKIQAGAQGSGNHDLLGKACRTLTDAEDVASGPVPRYGFRLRLSSRDGRRCLTSPWYEGCIGCLIPDNGSIPEVMDGDTLVVDWHFAVDVATSGFGCRATTDPLLNQPAPPRPRFHSVSIKNHASCGLGTNKGGQAGAITLEECLDAFAKEERIPEAYCSKCKDFRVQTKRMSLWRLPPVVIIHLKRFQFTQQMRRKLRDLVVFPIEGLDLSRIMAQEPNPSSTASKSRENGCHSSAKQRACDDEVPTADERDEDLHNDELLKDNGRLEKLYDLYGVVHHQGALSGGHYVASLRSEVDGHWRLFNDAQVYEIHARDVVDSSAYILFYIRRDVSKAKLSDFWDVRDGDGVSEDAMNQLIKGRSEKCVIS